MKKIGRINGEERIIKGDAVRGLREEGYKVYKSTLPRFLLVSPQNEVIFAEIKLRGERLSENQVRTMNMLDELKIKTMVVFQKGYATQKRIMEESTTRGKRRGLLQPEIEPFDSTEDMLTFLNKRGKIKDPNLADLVKDETESKVDSTSTLLNINLNTKEEIVQN